MLCHIHPLLPPLPPLPYPPLSPLPPILPLPLPPFPPQIMFTSGHASLHYSFTSPLSGYTSSTSSNLFSLWQVGNWSDCSVECGEGSQHRQVKCVDRHGVSVSEGMCKPITKPVNTMSCTRPACEQYHWSVGNWSEVRFMTHRQTNRQVYYAYSSHAVQTCIWWQWHIAIYCNITEINLQTHH